MHRYIYRLITFAILISVAEPLIAGPPDTLDFSGRLFVKTQERLYREPVRHVSLVREGSTTRPAVVFLESKIVFISKKGGIISERPLPPLDEFRVAESSNGKYVYAFATEGAGSFHAVYTSDGKVIFETHDTKTRGPLGWGLPLEKPKAFALSRAGRITVTKFDGKLLAEKVLLDTAKFEDGDIPLAAGADGRAIFAIANKFIFPMSKDQAPVFYAYDEKLKEFARDPKTYYLATGIQASPDGKYVAIHTELEDGTSPVMIADNKGREFARFESARAIKFSGDSKFLLHIPRAGAVEVYAIAGWQKIMSTEIPNPLYSWIDFNISDDGGFVTLFNADEILLLNTKTAATLHVNFPFAFDRCYPANGGRRLIITGEFGYCVYDVASK